MRRIKRKIGAITFHASYNYGSVLQAYALQEFVKCKFGNKIDYKIVNLRTDRQKDDYSKPYGHFDLKSIIKKFLFVGNKKQILNKKKKFEDFINNDLCLTDEYSSINALMKAGFDFDYYISGSDQIWNYSILDFDWSFFLEFCDKGKKISYAASFGPKVLELDEIVENRLKRDLSEYNNISVRESGSAERIRRILGDNIAEVHVDPTLLLKEKDWEDIVGKRIIKNDYILLYDLKSDKNVYEISKKLSKIYDIPVILVKEDAKMQFLYHGFIKKYDAGPKEFLNYIKYAKIVVSSSFHGNVFSIIFKKPFLAVGGKDDLRINSLLKLTCLEGRAINNINEINLSELFDIDFYAAELAIDRERERSKKYLAKALGIKVK